MRRCVSVKKRQKKRKHVSVRLAFPSASLFIILCLLRLFKGALFLCHFLAGASFFSPVASLCGLGRKDDGDYSTVACSAGLYHTVHAKYSPLRVCGGTRERASTNDLVCACMFASRKLTLGIIIHLKGSCWASIGLPCKYAISNRLNIEVGAAMSMFN